MFILTFNTFSRLLPRNMCSFGNQRKYNYNMICLNMAISKPTKRYTDRF